MGLGERCASGVHHKDQPLHGKNPGPLKIDYGSVCPLVMVWVSNLFFRVVSGDYGKPWPLLASTKKNWMRRCLRIQGCSDVPIFFGFEHVPFFLDLS